MKKLFTVLSWITGLWLLCSFLGVMFNPSRASLWTQSLMWALLAAVILAPCMLFIATAPSSSGTQQRPEKSFDNDDSDLSNYQTEEESTYQDQ